MSKTQDSLVIFGSIFRQALAIVVAALADDASDKAALAQKDARILELTSQLEAEDSGNSGLVDSLTQELRDALVAASSAPVPEVPQVPSEETPSQPDVSEVPAE